MLSINPVQLAKVLSDKFELDKDKVYKVIVGCKEDSLFYVKNYSSKADAIFGNTKDLYQKLKTLNEEKKKVAIFNSNLQFGPGIIITGKYTKEVKEFLKSEDVKYEEFTREEYEKRFDFKEKNDSKEPKKVAKKEDSKEPEKVAKKEDSKEPKKTVKKDSKEPKKTVKKDSKEPKKTVKKEDSKKTVKKNDSKVAKSEAKETKKLPAAKVQKKVKLNNYGNYEDSDTGIVFINLPVGENGKNVAIAVGVQNTDQEESVKGLESVNPLDSEIIDECKKHKFKFLDNKLMSILKTSDAEQFKRLKKWQTSHN